MRRPWVLNQIESTEFPNSSRIRFIKEVLPAPYVPCIATVIGVVHSLINALKALT